MAANTYIQSAIAQINSALNDLQAQMNDMHVHTHQNKQQIQHEIQLLEQEHKLHSIELTQQQDDSQRRVVQTRMEQIHHTCDDKRARMSQLDRELAGLQQRKTQVYNNLHNLLTQLQVLMASPDIH